MSAPTPAQIAAAMETMLDALTDEGPDATVDVTDLDLYHLATTAGARHLPTVAGTPDRTRPRT